MGDVIRWGDSKYKVIAMERVLKEIPSDSGWVEYEYGNTIFLTVTEIKEDENHNT